MSRRTVVWLAMMPSPSATPATSRAATKNGAAATPPANEVTPPIERAALNGKYGDAVGKRALRPPSAARLQINTDTTPAT